MAQRVITDIELRSHWTQSKISVLHIEPGAVLTPAARDFIRENGIRIDNGACDIPRAELRTMSRKPLPIENGRPVYRNAQTGAKTSEKGEIMTHLRENLLVPKTDPRIAFRGKLDTLQAQILCLQCSAAEKGLAKLVNDLAEVLQYTRLILGSEVKDERMPELSLFGMNSEELRRASHKVKESVGIDHPIPDYSMGSIALRLNLLRTQVREAELSCISAFTVNGVCMREDLAEGMNRLSSCVYILFCRCVAGQYGS